MFYRVLPFVAPSTVLVNIEIRAKVKNKPGSQRLSPTVPQGAQRPCCRLERGQQIAAAFASQITTVVDS